MEDLRRTAECDAPATIVKKTQRQRVLDTIEEQGFITMLGAWENVRLRITKLATRISEIEHDCGHRFQREPMYRVDGNGRKVRYNTKYTVPSGLTIDDFKTRS